MELVQIDIVRLEITQGNFDILPEPFRIHRAGFCGDDHPISHTRKGLAHFFLAVRIKSGSVKECDTPVISLP